MTNTFLGKSLKGIKRLMADNANRKSNIGRGSVRKGEALLAGLFRRGRCGRRLMVSYSGNGFFQRYVGRDHSECTTDKKCTSFLGSAR
jgi:hypothetical protein